MSIKRKHDFLLLKYKQMDFLINRFQFSTSSSLNNELKIKSSLPYLNKMSDYNNEKILLFNYNDYLQNNFLCSNDNSTNFCIIQNIDDYTTENRNTISKLLNSSSKISNNSLGLIVNNQAEIISINLREISLCPHVLRKELSSKGIYGCRFINNDRIQYFLDLEITIINAMKGATS